MRDFTKHLITSSILDKKLCGDINPIKLDTQILRQGIMYQIAIRWIINNKDKVNFEELEDLDKFIILKSNQYEKNRNNIIICDNH